MGVDGFAELDGFADTLSRAIPAIVPKVKPVVSKGALNIKTQLRDEATKSVHFKKAAWTISYDLTDDANSVEAEIGPEKKAAGNLANIAYFGGVNGGGGTVPDPKNALDDEASRFMAALELVVAL